LWTYGPAARELEVTKQTLKRLLQRDPRLRAAVLAALADAELSGASSS
jgi:hypothetical protein